MDENEKRRLLYTALQNEIVLHDENKIFEDYPTDDDMQEEFGCTREEAEEFLKSLDANVIIHSQRIEHTLDILLNGHTKEILEGVKE